MKYQINFKNGSRGLSIVAGLLAIGGIWSCFKADNNSKPLAINITVAAIACVATNEAVSRYYSSSTNEEFEKTIEVAARNLEEKNQEITRNKTVLEELQKFYEVRKNELTTTKEELELTQATLDALRVQLTAITTASELREENLQAKLQQEDTRFSEFVEEFRDAILGHLAERVHRFYNDLDRSIKSRITNEESVISTQLIKFSERLDEIFEEHNNLIEEIKLEYEPDEIFTAIVVKYSRIHEEMMSLRVRFRNILNIETKLDLDKAYELLGQYESAYVPLEKAKYANRQTAEFGKMQIDELRHKIDENDNSLEDWQNQVDDLLSEIEQKNILISKLKAPLKWAVATRDDLRIGNAIIIYFEGLGIVLDRAYSDYQKHQATLYFHIDRNDRVIVASEFNEHSEKLQQLTHTLTPIKFEFDGEQGLMKAYLQISKKPKKELEVNITKLWTTADRFPQIVSKWKRIRITGGSETGKSPTAENMIICILQAQKGSVEFYDPMHDSRKNYRTIPAAGKTHTDSIKALKDFKAKMDSAPSDRLTLIWLDEIDTTLDENPASAKDLKAVLKQSSHKNAGLVITGQNANVRNLKGNFDRSDMNNFVCVHIGDNYKDAIANSHLSETEQSDLLKRGDAIRDWCMEQNDKNGLTHEDPTAYRFALVMEPNKKPYYIELPEFGKYTYDQLEREEKPVCTNCGSINSIAHGAGRRLCKDCNKSFSI